MSAPLLELNRTEAEYPRDATIADLFAQQVARTPEAIAVAAGNQQLSYRELDERSNRLASQLQGLDVKPGTLVGVAMERSEALVVSLLAILKSGAAYVPLDARYPKDRLAWIIEDSRMQVLVTTPETRQQRPCLCDLHLRLYRQTKRCNDRKPERRQFLHGDGPRHWL
jgi:non-ribosomal peptide synthetase component F